jgi:hypothetical protein
MDVMTDILSSDVSNPRRIQRIQRLRKKGWRLPAGAVIVSRPSRWGNGFRGTDLDMRDRPLGRVRAVELYRLATLRFLEEGDAADVAGFLAPLRNATALACWCPLTDAAGLPVPCHADVLIELLEAMA